MLTLFRNFRLQATLIRVRDGKMVTIKPDGAAGAGVGRGAAIQGNAFQYGGKMNHDELISNGYRKYPAAKPTDLASALYQKRIRRGGVTLFFLNVHFYDYTTLPLPAPAGDAGWVFEVQFNTHGSQHPTFNVERWDDSPIVEIEDWFARMYDAMGCQPYEDD